MNAPTHKCPIETCTFEVPYSQLMCRGHWRLVPAPIQHEIYSCFRKRRGGPSHLAAIKRAIDSVKKTIAGWAEKNAESDAPEKPASLPYRDD